MPNTSEDAMRPRRNSPTEPPPFPGCACRERAAARGFLGRLVAGLIRAVAKARRRKRAGPERLGQLDDHVLRDIGLKRTDIAALCATGPRAARDAATAEPDRDATSD